jgi:hypothetical protein
MQELSASAAVAVALAVIETELTPMMPSIDVDIEAVTLPM